MNENINKVIYGTSTLIDLTEDTVSPDRMYKGDIAHDASGAEITGTAEITVDGTTLIMPEGLCNLIGTVDPETNHWVRPNYLPDLSSVYNGELNTLYMTVDATGRIPDPHVSIKIWCESGNYTVEVGNIENNSFVVSETFTIAHSNAWTKIWTPSINNYPVVKITAPKLRTFQLQSWTSSAGIQYHAQYQPIIEWIGDFEYSDGSARTPYFTEYEKINVRGCNNSFLQNRWHSAHYLQELDVSDWNTSTWTINSLSNTWYMCYNLKNLDVSNWDTSNWTVNSLNTTWYMCFNLVGLNLNNWETNNWRVTSLNDTWNYCMNLQYLYINTWDTSEWIVTNFNATWNCCFSLQELDLTNFDTSKWTVTSTMNNTWSNCRKLKYLDLSNFNTSNWSPTNLTAPWQSLYNITELKIENWDVSKFHVSNLTYTWQNCYKLKELDLSKWNVSNWPVNGSMAYTWQNCMELKKLDVSTWNTSNWNVTNMESTFFGLRQLEELDISNWDTSNWTVTNFAQTFTSCHKLKRLNLSKWNTSNWNITLFRQTFNECHSLIELNLTNWDMSNWSMTGNECFAYPFRWMPFLVDLDLSWTDLSKIPAYRNNGTYCFDSCRLLKNLTFGSNNNGKMNTTTTLPLIRFDWCILLTHQSLLNILNALANGVSGKTVQLGTTNLAKLTAEEKAIATNKGWTLT